MHSLSAVIKGVVAAVTVGAIAMAAPAAMAETLRIPVGRAHVVESSSTVTTVAIAAPDIADAAVGSARTVVVNGKSAGKTSLVVYNEGGRYTLYDVEVYLPNGHQQVKLHTRVAELSEDARKELGFDWYGNGSSSTPWLDGSLEGGLYTTKVSSPATPLSIGPATDGLLSYQKSGGGWLLETTWKALEEDGKIRMLADPTLVARSGQKAHFLAGGEFPVPIASGTGANGQTTVTIEWREFGVKVNFTPTVMDDGSVDLLVETEVSQINFTNPLSLSGFIVPTLTTRKTGTTVRMNSGEHLVIGGLKQTENTNIVRRVPILGHIPLLGFFFTNTVTESTDRELMVVVSPETVTPSSGALPNVE
jgi:pilus assembly protein CpaC